jgi:hypothetical protein
MIRRVAAALVGVVILCTPGLLFATSFSPFPTEPSVVNDGMIGIHLQALQLQFFRNDGSQLPDGTAIGPGTTEGTSGTLLRRAEVSLSGRVRLGVRYLVLADRPLPRR